MLLVYRLPEALCREVSSLNVKVKYLTIPDAKNRPTATVLLKSPKDAEKLLQIKFRSLDGKLIFFSKSKSLNNPTWILSGFPKQSTEFDILAMCYSSGTNSAISVHLDEKSGKAYIQFLDKSFQPLKSKNLVWKLKGTKLCRECQTELPAHSSACSKHFENVLFGEKLIRKDSSVAQGNRNSKPAPTTKNYRPLKRKSPE